MARYKVTKGTRCEVRRKTETDAKGTVAFVERQPFGFGYLIRFDEPLPSGAQAVTLFEGVAIFTEEARPFDGSTGRTTPIAGRPNPPVPGTSPGV